MRRLALSLVLAVLLVAPIVTGAIAVGAAAAAPNGTSTPTATPTPVSTPEDTASPTPTPGVTPAEPPSATPTPVNGTLEKQRRQDRVAELSDLQSSPYNYSWLSQPGTQAIADEESNLESVRALPKPPRSFVGLKYRDPSLLNVLFGSQPERQEVTPNTVVRENRVQLYGSTAGEYTLVTVYWERNKTRVNDSVIKRPVPYASNQTVERQPVTFDGDELLAYKNVSLTPHFDRTVRVTMWLESADGDRVAKWTFRHRSNPQLMAVNIDSLVGAWAFTFKNAVLSGLGFGIAGLFGARLTLRRTGRGPGFGVGVWAMLLGLTAMFTLPVAGFYYQVAVVLQHLPWLIGGVFGIMTYSIGLTFHEPVRLVAFLRRELYDSRTVGRRLDQLGASVEAATDGGYATLQEELGGAGDLFDELTDAFFSDLPEVPVVKTGDTYRVPVAGLGPFLARFFARAAEFDPSEVGTREIVREGRIDDIIHVDPGVDEALVHKPARLVNALPWTVLKREYAEREEDPTGWGKAIAAVLTVGILVAPSAAGWVAFSWLWNVGPVGLVPGIMLTAVMALTAEDGWIDFTPAPVHYRAAEQHLTALRRAYKEASENQTAIDRARRAEAMTTQEAREDREKEGQVMWEVLFGEDGSTKPKGSDGS